MIITTGELCPGSLLQRTTFGFLVVDDDCSPHVELLADLLTLVAGDGMFRRRQSPRGLQ